MQIALTGELCIYNHLTCNQKGVQKTENEGAHLLTQLS